MTPICESILIPHNNFRSSDRYRKKPELKEKQEKKLFLIIQRNISCRISRSVRQRKLVMLFRQNRQLRLKMQSKTDNNPLFLQKSYAFTVESMLNAASSYEKPVSKTGVLFYYKVVSGNIFSMKVFTICNSATNH